MSFDHMARVRALPPGSISSSAHAVLFELAYRADDNGVCWPAIGNIAAQLAFSDRAVRSALAQLKAAGYVQVTRRRRPNGSYRSNGYQLRIPTQPHQLSLIGTPPSEIAATCCPKSPPPAIHAVGKTCQRHGFPPLNRRVREEREEIVTHDATPVAEKQHSTWRRLFSFSNFLKYKGQTQ